MSASVAMTGLEPNAASMTGTVAVVGPTGAGKGELGLRIAERLGRPILVCDSVKVYRGLDIGSAKPSVEARARVAHHLVDCVDPDQPFTAGDYARRALPLLRETGGIFVGGTGLYLRATAWTQTGADLPDVGRGVDDPERAAFEATWRAREDAERGAVHRALSAIDEETAAKIHPGNIVRLIRALWLCRVHGGPVSRARREDPPRPRVRLMLLVLDPGAEALDRRIARRVDAMLEAGWLAEVEKLMKAGYDSRHKAMRSLGYRQLVDVVLGRMDIDEAKESIVVATRQYARRQRTYFRHQLPAHAVVHLDDAKRCPWRDVEAFVAGGSP